MSYAAIIDARFEALAMVDGWTMQPDSDVVGFVRQLLDDGVETVVAVGDDATLGRVATAHAELLRDRVELLRFFVVAAGNSTTVADVIGSPAAKRSTFRKLDRLVDAASVRRLPSLRIVDSAEPTARLGFTIGKGLPYWFWSTYAESTRSGRTGSAEAFARLVGRVFDEHRERAVEADVFVDWELRAERFGYFLASALDHVWFDVAMDSTGPSMRMGNSGVELVAARSRLGRVVERARHAGFERFDRIHIDTNTGYVVDGEPCASERPRTVAVTSGPTIQCLAPS